MDRGPAFFMFAVAFTLACIAAAILRPYIGEGGVGLIVWAAIAGGLIWFVRRRKA